MKPTVRRCKPVDVFAGHGRQITTPVARAPTVRVNPRRRVPDVLIAYRRNEAPGVEWCEDGGAYLDNGHDRIYFSSEELRGLRTILAARKALR